MAGIAYTVTDIVSLENETHGPIGKKIQKFHIFGKAILACLVGVL